MRLATMSRLTLRAAIIAFGTIGAAALAPAAGQLFFTDLFNPDFNAGHIHRVNTDGSGFGTLTSPGGGLRGLDVDMQDGKMYWADVNDWKIRRANIDGSGTEELIQLSGVGEDPPFPSALALHKPGGKIYWGDQLLGTIHRANLDGTGQEVIVNTPFHRGLAIDGVNGKMYWSTSISQFKGEIWRANLDGTGAESVISSLDTEFKPNKIALDIASGKIYWTDYVVDIVRRSNLDGSAMETLYVPPFNRNPQGIALDLQAGLVYWGQDLEIEGHTGKIMVANLNGSGAHDFLTGFGHVTEVVFAPVPEPATLIVVGLGALALTRRRSRN